MAARTEAQCRRVYASRRWRDVTRPLQLRRHPLCDDHEQRGQVVQATQVDHRKPLKEGGDPWDPSNLRSLCAPCHSVKTNADKTGGLVRGCDVQGRPMDPRHHWNR